MKKVGNFSVLISIYFKESSSYFRECLDSIYSSTIIPGEMVIVHDGPVRKDMLALLESYDFEGSSLIEVKLPENRGLGVALAKGVVKCSFDIIFRMDADDICRPNRFEDSLLAFKKYPKLNLLGGYISEFKESPSSGQANLRTVPTSWSGIKSQIFFKNPFNHMTVAFRRDAVMCAGNYEPMSGYEDYLLWVKMVFKHEALNIPKILVDARAGSELIARRRGVNMFLNECRFQQYLLKNNYITKIIFIRNIFLRGVFRLMPIFVVHMMYKLALRTRPNSKR